VTDPNRPGDDGHGATRRPSAWLLLPITIAAVAGLARWSTAETGPGTELEPQVATVAIASSGPVYATVEDITAASDLVLIATVAAAEPGRTISDPARPDVGIRTTLYRLDVERLLVGSANGDVVVEHETNLTDGTPIAINGAPAPTVGSRVLLFLVAGQSDAFPHHAIISEQGQYQIAGQRLVAATPHPLVDEIAGLGLDDLVDSVTTGDP